MSTISIYATKNNIDYNQTSEIIVKGMENIYWSPMNSILTTGKNPDGSYYATVKPQSSTRYYAYGTDKKENVPTFIDIVIYVNITLLQNEYHVDNGTELNLTAYGSDIYSWTPKDFLNNDSTNSVQCIPKNDIQYTIQGIDYFGRITYTYLSIFVSSHFDLEPENPTVYSSDPITIRIKNNNSHLRYEWKPVNKIFVDNSYVQQYGTEITMYPLYTTYMIVTGVNNDEKVVSYKKFTVTVIDKPPHLLDIDLLPARYLDLILSRNKKELGKQLLINRELSKKIISFYYTQLMNTENFMNLGKTSSGFTMKWKTVQEYKSGRPPIIKTGEQSSLYRYINYHQTRNGQTTSNFAFLINTVNNIYLEKSNVTYVINQ